MTTLTKKVFKDPISGEIKEETPWGATLPEEQNITDVKCNTCGYTGGEQAFIKNALNNPRL